MPSAHASTVTVRKTGQEFTVNSSTSGLQLSPSIAASSPDQIVVTWSGDRSGEESNQIIWARRIGHGGTHGPEVVVNKHVIGTFSAFPAIGQAANNWAVVWVDADNHDGDYEGIFGRRLDSNLNPVGVDEFQINTFTQYYQRFPAVSVGPAGAFFVAWHDSGHPTQAPKSDIKGRLYTSEGLPRGDEFPIALTDEGEPFGIRLSAFADGGYVATWAAAPLLAENEYDVFFRTYDASGNAGPVTSAITRTFDRQAYPDVAACPDGRFLIAWQSSSVPGDPDVGVFAQWFDRTGQRVADEFHVNQFVDGLQNLPTLAVTSECEAIVVWQSRAQDGDREGVYARIFKPGGEPVTDEIRVNTTTQGRQGYEAFRETAVVADSNTTFFVTWSADPLSVNDSDIIGQGFCWLGESASRVCGNSQCLGDSPGGETLTASDALLTLRAAVGIETCSPCRCDTDASGGITSTDALQTLRAAVSLPVDLRCPLCGA